jgi:transposase InsO family protein
MKKLYLALFSYIRACFKLRHELEAENVALRQQLGVARRKGPKRIRIGFWDRVVLVVLYRLSPSVLDAIHIVRPATVVRWHRQGFKAYWRWKSRPKGGRPKIDQELRNLIKQMGSENPLWGAPRLHGELLLLGYSVSQSTVARYMVKRRGNPGGQSWKAFLENHRDGIASMDFIIVPTIHFKLLYCLVILSHARRKIIHYAVTTVPTAAWVARQLADAFPWDEAPDYLIRDNDPVFNTLVQQKLRLVGIRDRPTTPYSPWQNGHSERLNGSIRRECLDHIISFGESHLRRIMKAYVHYYNNVRTHLTLGKNPPKERQIKANGLIKSVPHLGGLHHEYVRI